MTFLASLFLSFRLSLLLAARVLMFFAQNPASHSPSLFGNPYAFPPPPPPPPHCPYFPAFSFSSVIVTSLGFLAWRSERHRHVQLCSDTSSFAWRGGGGELPPTIGLILISIVTSLLAREALALANVLESFAPLFSNSWVDVSVDSMVLLSASDRQGSRSRPLFNALKRIFTQVLSSNVFLNLQYIPSSCNPADFPSHRLSHMDASLSPVAWDKLQRLFGGNAGHSIDLMALPSNVQCDLSGQPLPFFSPYPTPGCAGVNVFAQTPASHSPSCPYCPAFSFSSVIVTSLYFDYSRRLSEEILVAFASGYSYPILYFSSQGRPCDFAYSFF